MSERPAPYYLPLPFDGSGRLHGLAEAVVPTAIGALAAMAHDVVVPSDRH